MKNHKRFIFRPRYIHTAQKAVPKISCESPFKVKYARMMAKKRVALKSSVQITGMQEVGDGNGFGNILNFLNYSVFMSCIRKFQIY
jgi:hypothetical protein